jgi:hypothetical protein
MLRSNTRLGNKQATETNAIRSYRLGLAFRSSWTYLERRGWDDWPNVRHYLEKPKPGWGGEGLTVLLDSGNLIQIQNTTRCLSFPRRTCASTAANLKSWTSCSPPPDARFWAGPRELIWLFWDYAGEQALRDSIPNQGPCQSEQIQLEICLRRG